MQPPAQASTLLRGRRLWLARVAWVALAGTVLILFAASTVPRYHDLATPTPSVQAELNRLGYSAQAYALVQVGIDTLFVLVCAAVSIIIFWRKSSDSMVLHVGLMLVTWGR